MKNKRIILGIVVVLAIYAVIMIIMFYKKNSNINTDKYLIVNNNLNLKFNNGKYVKVGTSEIENSNIEFKAYVNNNYFGKYYLKYGGSWNLFDKSNNFIKYDGSLIAVSDGYELDFDNLNSRTINDDEKNYLTSKYGINNYDFLITNEVYDIDLDKNGTMDKIICISNSYYYSLSETYIENYDIKNNYSLVLVILNGDEKVIHKEIGKNDITVYSVIGSFRNDAKQINIIMESTVGYISENPTSIDEIYTYKNNTKKFDKIISN